MAVPMFPEDDWQSKKSVVERNRHMLNNDIASDITFLVGEREEPVKAHKYILISGSCVFYAMLHGPFQDARIQEIPVPDVDIDTFNQMLLFLYTEEARIDVDNVLPLMYAAKKYCIQSLIDRCLRRLKVNMTPENIPIVLQNASMFGEVDLKDRAIKAFLRNPKEVFRFDTYLDLNADDLMEILGSDELALQESEIFNILLKYSEKKCQEQGLEVNGENRRQVLGDLVKVVRFTKMDKDYFQDKVEPSGIIPDDQLLKMYKYFMKPQGELEGFVSRKRRFRYTCHRFASHGSGWGYKRDKTDGIGFSVSKDIVVHGATVYGSNQGPANFEVLLLLKEQPYHADMAVKRTIVQTDGIQKTYEVLFDNPVPLSKTKKYTFTMTMKGPSSFYGEKGEMKVKCEGVDFEFEKSNPSYSSNNTVVERGQLPGVVFELPDGEEAMET